MPDLKISTRLSLMFMIIGILPILIISLLALQQGGKSLTNQGIGQLESIRELKKTQIMDFFFERRKDLNQLINVVEMLKVEAFDKLEGIRSNKRDQIEFFFAERITDVRVMSQRNSLAQAVSQFNGAFLVNGGKAGGMAWDEAADRFSEELKLFRDQYGYADLLLIASSGDIIYSVEGGDDLGANLNEAPLKDSSLAAAFSTGLEGVGMEDYAPYAPFGNEPSAFITAPIKLFNETIGVLALRIPIQPILEITGNRTGMGKSGSVYLINTLSEVIGQEDEGGFYAPSQQIIGVGKREAIFKEVMAESAGTRIVENEHAALKLVSFSPIDTGFFRWALVVEMSLEEVINPVSDVGGKGDFLSEFVSSSGYDDLYLIHPGGRIFYTMKHRKDYGTNILSGPFKGSELGVLVKSVLGNRTFGMSDVAPYPPANGEPSNFIAQPLIAQDDVVFLVALQMSDQLLDALMSQRDGMGDTGETYLVGSDKLLRSNSLLDPERYSVAASFANPEQRNIDTPAVAAALGGETGTQWLINYLGSQVLSSFTPIRMGQQDWALIAEVNQREILSPVSELRLIFLVVGFIVAVLVVISGWFFSRTISNPLDGAINTISRSSAEIATTITQHEQVATHQATSVTETNAIMTELDASAKQSAQQAENAAASAKVTMGLSTSGMELVQESMYSMEYTKDKMTAITNQILLLSEQTDQIRDITQMVADFAGETKMLAMNAAVEAVRAGEHGKGFSVLAVETRKLADESKTSASRINSLVGEIQKATNATVMAAEEGSKTVEKGMTVTRNTADTFQEVAQAARDTAENTEQISLNVKQQSIAVKQVVEAMKSIASGAKESKSGVSQIKLGVQAMDEVTQRLRKMI